MLRIPSKCPNSVSNACLAALMILLAACGGSTSASSADRAVAADNDSSAAAPAVDTDPQSTESAAADGEANAESDNNTDTDTSTSTDRTAPAPTSSPATNAAGGSGSPTTASLALADRQPSARDWTAVGQTPVRPLAWTPIMVDQFGYLPAAAKVAVVVDPQVGFNDDLAFSPGATLEVRSAASGEVVFSAPPVLWNDGQVDFQSGDRGWWFDFSTVTTPGTYVVVDPASGTSSYPFEVGADVYDELLDVALRAFWYNRGNVPHALDLSGPWSGEATLIGPGQDTEARWVDERDNADTARDLSGGWYDAGDTNKYVTFAAAPVHQLLSAYESTPEVFDDEVGIPESGNGVPDILDEVRWELEWLERMQEPDGGVLLKVGFVDFNDPPSIYVDERPRYYEESCSSSTIAAASMFAHGARAFADIDPVWADQLLARAESAHDWYLTHEKRNWCDEQIVKAGDADISVLEQEQLEVVTAIYLFDLTGDDEYHNVIKDRLTITNPWHDGGFGRYEPEQAAAVALYRSRPDAVPSLVAEIDDRITRMGATASAHGWSATNSLYRSFMPDPQYHWGSNMVMANTGNANLALLDLGFDPENSPLYLDRAGAHLTTLHGVNPLGLTYLTNMGEFGAERSVTEVYHYLYRDGSEYDSSASSAFGPAPGYLAGGPNTSYTGVQSPPANQPISKSYLDWNTSTIEDRSWEISEPAIYYQSAYIRLLAGVIDAHG